MRFTIKRFEFTVQPLEWLRQLSSLLAGLYQAARLTANLIFQYAKLPDGSISMSVGPLLIEWGPKDDD